MGFYSESDQGDGLDRRWVVCGVVAFGLTVVLLILLGVGVYRLYSLGIIGGASPEPTDQNPILFALTQTALAGEAGEALQEQAATQAEQTALPAPTDTLIPVEATDQPTETPTETLQPTLGPAIFTPNQGTFCRRGPSTIYTERTSLNAGQTAPILGKGTSPVDGVSIWWLVLANGVECFVSSTLGTTSGDLASIPVVAAPPTPTPTPTPTDTPTPTPTPTP